MDVCTPDRQSRNHPESSQWKQRWGPFSRRWSYISFYFWHRLVLSTQMRGGLLLLVFVARRWWKRCWCRAAWVMAERGSECRGSESSRGCISCSRCKSGRLSFARFPLKVRESAADARCCRGAGWDLGGVGWGITFFNVFLSSRLNLFFTS